LYFVLVKVIRNCSAVLFCGFGTGCGVYVRFSLCYGFACQCLLGNAFCYRDVFGIVFALEIRISAIKKPSSDG